MIKIKNLTVKNFMSIGNATQAVDFDRDDLTLVLGENLDLGSNGSRNGTGKTTLINALSYGLYGSALSDIKVNNLINKTNGKNMLVSVEFDIDAVEYRIERGRKPNLLKFFKNNQELVDENEAQGEQRETQKDIAGLLGISHDMFKHSIALNTYTTPFLSMRAVDQKNIIEELLGITVLSEKAEALKITNKIVKDNIKEENFRLEAVIKANEHIEEQIAGLERRQRMWKLKKDETVGDYTSDIEKLMEIDINNELQKHKDNADARETAKSTWYQLTSDKQEEHDVTMNEFINEKAVVTEHNASISKHNAEILDCNRWIQSIESDRVINEKRLQGLAKDIELINEHKCHACGQELHDEKHEEIKAQKEQLVQTIAAEILAGETQEMEHKQTLAELGSPLETKVVPEKPVLVPIERIEPLVLETFYSTIDEAHGHKSSFETLTSVQRTDTRHER